MFEARLIFFLAFGREIEGSFLPARRIILEPHIEALLAATAAFAIPVILKTRDPQAGQAVLFDHPLPGQKFLDGKTVSLACFLEAQEASADGSDNFGFPAYHPPTRLGGRQIRQCQRLSIRSDHMGWAAHFYLLGHFAK